MWAHVKYLYRHKELIYYSIKPVPKTEKMTKNDNTMNN